MLDRSLFIKLYLFIFFLTAQNLFSQTTTPNENLPPNSLESKKELPKTDDTSHDEDFFKMEESIAAPSREKGVTASRTKEKLLEAPASMMIITEEDIKKRGYTSIDEIFYDLPGFDISFANGAQYISIYQRGYRTPFTQRCNRLIFQGNTR